ncbi:MAG TPA: hypothetical protein DCY71_01395 [Clostridiaceae bacterium]|nr:hypothetical protein [Clostridiaceae bacterium]
MTILYLCPYCGAYYYYDSSEENIKNLGLTPDGKPRSCNWCQNIGDFINTHESPNFFATKYMTKDQYQLSEHIMNDYVRNNPLYSKEAETKRIEAETAMEFDSEIHWRNLRFDPIPLTKPKSSNTKVSDNTKTINTNQSNVGNVPRCPTCGSTDVEKISTASKVGKGFLFGVFSMGTLTKTYKCNKCGYKW